MKNKIFLSLFLFFSLASSRSYANFVYGTSCPADKPYLQLPRFSFTHLTSGGILIGNMPRSGYDTYSQKIVFEYCNDSYDWNGNEYCHYDQEFFYCTAVNSCSDDEVEELNSNGVPICVSPPLVCPINEHTENNEDCICNNGFPRIDGICQTPSICPSSYDSHVPPLPLFKETDNISKCNFFNFGDNAVLTLDNLICCYGQEMPIDDNNCPLNNININGNCYPIESNDDNETNPKECPNGSYWSMNADKCLKWFPDNNDTQDPSNPDSGVNDGDLNGDNQVSSNDKEELSFWDEKFNDAVNFDGLKNNLEKFAVDYVLVKLPVRISGSCSGELRKTFNLFGASYTLDLSSNMQVIYDYMPMLKMIILFLASVTGVLIVMSNKGD